MVESKLSSSLQFNYKGQGTIEYLLLLVITISMVLLAMANLFKPMQAFMQNFMGTYVACLLSSGELPAIRSENTLKDAEPKCNFSLVAGNATVGNGSNSNSNNPGNTGSNGNKNDDTNNSNNAKDGKDKATGDGSNDSGNSSPGSNTYAGSRSRRSAFGSGPFLRNSADSTRGSDEMAGDGGKRYINNLDRNGNDRYFQSRKRTTQVAVRNGRGLALNGMMEDEQKKQERKIQTQPRVLPKNSEEFSVPGKKSLLKPPPPREKILIKQEDETFTFGNFLKYIIIAIILLLIFILGGGQAFEMSKSMD